MTQATARDRAAWFRWHREHGENVAATCRQFGISRASFYRWQQRCDPAHPLQSLKRRRPRRPTQQRPAPLQAEFFGEVLALSVAHPRWGRVRIRRALLALQEDVPAEATIGRWLASILARCPVCKGCEGVHHGGAHALVDDIVVRGAAHAAHGPDHDGVALITPNP